MQEKKIKENNFYIALHVVQVGKRLQHSLPEKLIEAKVN